MPKSTVSKRVGELEARLGVRLIQRTSRSFVLTDVGHEVHEHARAALIEIEGAEAAVRRRLAEPSGTVRLTASIPTIQLQLAEQLPRLATVFPKLRLVVHATDRFVDLVQEGFDIAVRSHFAPLPDSGLVQRRLRVQPILLVASPAYLEARGTHPSSRPSSRSTRACSSARLPTTWRLRRVDGVEAWRGRGERLTVDESVALLNAATAGLGIVPLPGEICREHSGGPVASCGSLPDWTAGEVTTSDPHSAPARAASERARGGGLPGRHRGVTAGVTARTGTPPQTRGRDEGLRSG